MIELYLSKVTESSETETAGKLYARVSYKQSMDLHDMAHHMAEHNTAFSEGLIVGVLTDFVKCTREMVLNGNTVKVGNLAIFKATVESNGLEVLYDAQSDKVASATMGTLKDFTRDELKKDVKLSWTDKTKAEIAAAKGETSANTGNAGGTSNTGSNTGGTGSNTGGTGSNTGGGSTGGNTGGGTQGGDGDHDSDGGTNSDE